MAHVTITPVLTALKVKDMLHASGTLVNTTFDKALAA